MTLVICRTAVFLTLVSAVSGSWGDSSEWFLTCHFECHVTSCAEGQNIAEFYERQPLAERLLLWSCEDDCNYLCIWPALQEFKGMGFSTPKFYGKWPFVRYLGMQEPASAIFSFLNGLCHVIFLRRFRRRVPSSAPLYSIYSSAAAITITSWLWSTVFHSRDHPVTEKLDYYFALSVVFLTVFLLCARLLVGQARWKLVVCTVVIVLAYLQHIAYMTFVSFDYSYNMKVNVVVGLINATGWLFWCARVRRKQPYVWRAVLVILLPVSILWLEVWDFEPVWYIFDAHSLWHAGTIIIPVVWWRFAADDCLYLYNQKYLQKSEAQEQNNYWEISGTETLASGKPRSGSHDEYIRTAKRKITQECHTLHIL